MASSAAVDDKVSQKKGLNKRPLGVDGGGPGGRGAARNPKPKKMPKAPKPDSQGSADEVLTHDIRALLAAQKLHDEAKPLPRGDTATKTTTNTTEEDVSAEDETLPEPGTEIEVEVLKLSSTGDGLARQPGFKQIYVVPFSLPGDIVKVKVYRHFVKENYSVADYITVVKPGPLRDDSRATCKYFTKCSGCQFQHMTYEDQLAHKRSIVEHAFQNFSQLPPELVPTVQDTVGSPLQYGYRTKLTPHFDAPPGAVLRRGKPREKIFFQEVPDIGYNEKGRRVTLDIEDCPIGTDALRKGMARERARMKVEYGNYSSGATILLRESTRRLPKPKSESEAESEQLKAPLPADAVVVDTKEYRDIKTCVTDNNAETTEYVDEFIFTNPAGSFFQNNNSILPHFTDYIRQRILPPSTTPEQKPVKYLIDAYSGSGLFTITLSSLFSGGSIGIDIDEKSIIWARRNADLNKLSEERVKFIAANAPELFQQVSVFDPDETVVVLDPPRRGCDGSFLRQLLKFAPRRIVYVSCNVHTQARDVGNLVRGEVSGMGDDRVKEKPLDEWEALLMVNQGPPVGGEGNERKARYEIESIRGFDFFPQTSHVEGVAVLNRVIDD